MRSKQFGGKPTKQLLEQYQQSANWKDGKFQNLEITQTDVSLHKIPGILYQQLTNRSSREPAQPLSIAPFQSAEFLEPAASTRFIWYGHSAVLMRMKEQTILIDPMLGPNASPIAPITTRRFSKDTLNLIDDFPEIDLLLLTHDHYDHLDFASIQRLQAKTKKYFVALGIKRHLVHWGIAPDLITEFDWWDNRPFGEISITFTPTRHFSGRGLLDRAMSLWGGWAFQTDKENIWFSGDGGYGRHFQEIGERLGPFDFAFMECGQYNEHWRPIHMFPEECAQAALDARAQKIMPVHWAGFALAPHHWREPADHFHAAVVSKKVNHMFPYLGKPYLITDKQLETWWKG